MTKRKRKSSSGAKKQTWTPPEDDLLLILVNQFGDDDGIKKQWNTIAKQIPGTYEESVLPCRLTDFIGFLGRNGKQCRERYHNQLDAKIKKNVPWTEHEDLKLVAEHRCFESYVTFWLCLCCWWENHTHRHTLAHWSKDLQIFHGPKSATSSILWSTQSFNTLTFEHITSHRHINITQHIDQQRKRSISQSSFLDGDRNPSTVRPLPAETDFSRVFKRSTADEKPSRTKHWVSQQSVYVSTVMYLLFLFTKKKIVVLSVLCSGELGRSGLRYRRVLKGGLITTWKTGNYHCSCSTLFDFGPTRWHGHGRTKTWF